MVNEVYFNGGCRFVGEDANCKVLARYQDIEDQPAAIIECKVGQGKAILSGVHPEYSGWDLCSQDAHLISLLPSLVLAEKQRRFLFQSLLSRLLN
jgi:glutamine amidotransferase-like uncharacterized protein